MHYSTHSLHPPVLKTQAHRDLLGAKLALVAQQKRSVPALRPRIAAAAPSVGIPLSAVSLAGNFDAYIDISYRGAAADFAVQLLVDSGNSSLIVPNFSDLANLPNFSTDYTVVQEGVQEPWGCPASIVRGPIELPFPGGVFEIPDCEFYACVGQNDKGKLTANFGVGCLAQRGAIDVNQSPFACIPDYPYAEFQYGPAAQMFSTSSNPSITTGSLLTFYQSIPSGYQMFDIVKDQNWMSLRPKSLCIANTTTGWPGVLIGDSIAMVDTGGGPVFLSDPKSCLLTTDWPQPAPVPSSDWLLGSYSCQSISADLNITLGDDKNSFSYHIDPTILPPSLQGLSLVICKQCSYMFSQNGMNIGGLSALFNNVLIDYAGARVGFKPKPAHLV